MAVADPDRRRRQARVLRFARTVHRTTGIALFVVFFAIGTTGLLLGWKKHTGGALLAKSYKGTSTEPRDWLPIHVLHDKAVALAREHLPAGMPLTLDRIDIRPDKGMVKFVFADAYWGLQLDLATGELLHVERRRADFIENVHDGSIFDGLAGTSSGQLKLIYTSLAGTALLVFSISGFWLWYGPRRMRVTAR